MSTFQFADKSILVTGASSGIGRALAIALATQGAKVIIVGRDEERLLDTYNQLQGEGHTQVKADLTATAELDLLVKSLPVLNGVVFNAGAAQYDLVKFISPEKINDIFSVNYTANVMLTQKLLKNKKIAKGASLVYVSSISSKLGVPGTAIYASSKAAITAFSKVVASEVAAQGIRANSISPGIIKTPMTFKADGVVSEEAMAEAEKDYPLGYGLPSDIEGIIAFLLSDQSRWMTGTDIVMDGGFTLK